MDLVQRLPRELRLRSGVQAQPRPPRRAELDGPRDRVPHQGHDGRHVWRRDRARIFTGEATVNGGSGYHYTITVQDNGEPGHGTDWIDFTVTNDSGFFYHPTGDSGAYLAGGNIQVHENP